MLIYGNISKSLEIIGNIVFANETEEFTTKYEKCKDVGASTSEVSSAFLIHPTIASTPVPEGVTVRFSPTAVDGYVWGHSSQLHQMIMQIISAVSSAVSS